MKALIIDDEPPVITVVRLLVEWEKYGIHEVFDAASAGEAMEVIRREKPEIILSDINLPDLNGLDLIDRLQKTDASAKIIIISAFDRFSYAQKAVELGCVEYILKPVRRDVVNAAVAKAVRKFEEDAKLKSESKITRVQSLLSLYLSAGRQYEILEELMELFPWMKTWTSFFAGVIPMGFLSDETASLYNIQEKACRFAFENRIGAASVWGNTQDILILIDGARIGAELKCLELLKSLQSEFGVRLFMGISGKRRFPQEIEAAYRQAQEAAVSADLSQPACMIEKTVGTVSPITTVEWMNDVLFAGFPSAEEERIRHSLAGLAERAGRNGRITTRHLDNFRTLYNSIRNQHIHKILGNQKNPAGSVQPLKRSFCRPDGIFRADYFADVVTQDMMLWAEKCMPASPAESISEVCRRVKRYLEAHYREELSMEEMARFYAVSPSYLSRSFKKEMGMGMNEMLTAIRIERAAGLLKDGVRPSEVSEAVGFLDPKYFSRVFRKATGMTPSDYRKAFLKGEGTE